jgi:GT2 family glycosyltransferase
LPTSLVNRPGVERVPAVSAACLMIERDLYERLGGLDERYIVGDYEDSDLCLKAAREGRPSYVVREETLFHLERQSQSLAGHGSWRLRLTLYNAWRHGRIWADEIASSAKGST